MGLHQAPQTHQPRFCAALHQQPGQQRPTGDAEEAVEPLGEDQCGKDERQTHGDDADQLHLAGIGRQVARGPVGAEPLLVQVGFTRFAMRRSEAQRVRLHVPEA